MGQRANYIIVEKQKYRLYYSHWSANTIDYDFFWGPSYTLDFILNQKVCKQDEWLDEVWCEGGAVLDLDHKVLLFFGGEDILLDIPLRKVFLNLLQIVWQGWQIRWAYEGIVDLAEYVGVPRSNVLVENDDPFETDDLILANAEYAQCVCSICRADGQMAIYPLSHEVEELCSLGPSLWKKLLNLNFCDTLSMELPWGGLHLDEKSQTLGFWVARAAPNLCNRIGKYWPNWSIETYLDNYTYQEEKTRWQLRYQVSGEEELIKNLIINLSTEMDSTNPILYEFANTKSQVEVNPLALEYNPQKLPPESKSQILQYALQTYSKQSK